MSGCASASVSERRINSPSASMRKANGTSAALASAGEREERERKEAEGSGEEGERVCSRRGLRSSWRMG